MPPVQVIEDATKLIPTSEFPYYAKFPQGQFNPVQSAAFQIHNKDCNAIVAAKTGAGKTWIAEMFLGHEVHERGGKGVYLVPLRALAKEKIDDWTDPDHHFFNLNLSICTGDYQLTANRKKEIEKSNIILMTSEMLCSRTRNYKSEKNEFLKDIGTICIDESHLLTVPGRGDHLEVAMMKLSQIAPNARFVLLSATMPNVKEIAEWVSYSLTGKETYLLESQYRPCPLYIHYEDYWPSGDYESNEKNKVQAAIDLFENYSEDRFLFFVHTKRTGELLKKNLAINEVECELHNSDLDKAKRQSVEKRFREGNLRAVVATSGLAWGLNFPARRVVIVGVHRGINEVDTYDVWQMAGRAGRPGFDPQGDVYILVPDNKANYHIKRLEAHQKIESRLLDRLGDGDKAQYKILAFHLVSEIHHRHVKTKDDVHDWYEKSFAHFQAKDLNDKIVDKTLDSLIKCSAIKEENGEYSATSIGVVASMFYYSPFDISDLRRNFRSLFMHNLEGSDIVTSMCLGGVETHRFGIATKAEKADMGDFKKQVVKFFGSNRFNDPEIKAGFAYYCLMKGQNPRSVASYARTLQWDFPRLAQVLRSLDTMSGRWKKMNWFNELQSRITYGVSSELVPLCKIPDVGKVRAERLFAAGIKTVQDVVYHRNRLSSILKINQDRADKIANAAMNMALA